MKPIFFTTMGYPGAGKSYFAKRLSARINAVRLNSDSMRNIMFVDPEKSFNSEGYHTLFGALDYAASEVIKAGYDIIYDAKCNRRSEREKNARVASENGGEHITLWVQTPFEVALIRASTREVSLDQRKLTAQHLKEHKSADLEEPGLNERHIIIEGQIEFEKQYESFVDQLKSLKSKMK